MAERYIPEHRRTQFKAKNTFKPEELRRRREEQQVEIRKAKREENLAKRRGIGTGENRPGASLGAAPDSDDESAPTESQVCASAFFLSPLLSVLHGLGYFTESSLLARSPCRPSRLAMWGERHFPITPHSGAVNLSKPGRCPRPAPWSFHHHPGSARGYPLAILSIRHDL